MKLLFAIKQLENAAGGAERVLANVTADLAARGHQVSVLSWDRADAAPFYRFDPRVRLLFRGIGNAARPATVCETLRRMVDLRRTVAREAPDVAIGFCHAMFVPLAFALAGSGIAIVGSEHITIEHYRARPLQYALLRLAACGMRRITVMSEAVKRAYTADVRRKMAVLANPIMAEPLPALTREPRKVRTILNVGRLDPQKDQQTLIRAFGRLATAFPDWTLRIAGEGALRPELTRLIADLHLETRVVLVGITNDIEAEYAGADIFALPSRYESYGLVSIEAMAQGLPVVGFADCPGTNEVVTDGVEGLLVAAGEDRVSAFADALRRLMDDAPLRTRLGERGWRSVARMRRECRVIDDWEDLLRQVGQT